MPGAPLAAAGVVANGDCAAMPPGPAVHPASAMLAASAFDLLPYVTKKPHIMFDGSGSDTGEVHRPAIARWKESESLDELALRLRALTYESAIDDCTIPSRKALGAATGATLDEVKHALTELADAHMLVLQRESGEILMANPFSAVPTPFVVTSGARSWYGNCIWDSMGISAMIGESVTLRASCGCCGSAMSLAIPQECGEDERLAHFAIPAAHWWDDIVFN
jgi:Alkylmercury lyase